jgi:hypothetical protein
MPPNIVNDYEEPELLDPRNRPDLRASEERIMKNQNSLFRKSIDDSRKSIAAEPK